MRSILRLRQGLREKGLRSNRLSGHILVEDIVVIRQPLSQVTTDDDSSFEKLYTCLDVLRTTRIFTDDMATRPWKGNRL